MWSERDELGEMKASEVLEMTSSRPRRELADGELLIRAGVPQSALYVLESGSLDVELNGQRINAVGEPGSVLGEISMLLDLPASADVRADGPVMVRQIDDADQLFNETPLFARFVATTLARRLHRITGYLEDLQQQFADQTGTLGLVPKVLQDLMGDTSDEIESGSDRETESPY